MNRQAIGSAAAAALCVLAGAAHAKPTEDYGLCFWPADDDKDGNTKRLVWPKILNQVKLNLGKAKQVNWSIDACFSGQAIAQTDTGGFDLGVPTAISTASEATKVMYYNWVSKDNDPAQRLKVDNSYLYSWSDYATLRLRDNNPVPTVKDVFDSVKAKLATEQSSLKFQKPQFALRGGASETLKIQGDGTKTRTVIFGGDTNGMNINSQKQMYNAYKAYAPDSIVQYRNNYVKQDTNPPFEGEGTWANFKSALGTLKTQLDAGEANKQVVNLHNVGHGTKFALNDGKLDGRNTPQGVGDGYLITGSAAGPDSLDIPMSADMWTFLKVGLLPNDEGLWRVQLPEFHLAYSAQNAPGPFGVSISGLSLGTFMLSPGQLSGDLVVPLSDTFLSALIAQFDGVPTLSMQFTLSPGQSIRVGTLDDLLDAPDYRSVRYGTGLSVVVAAPTPGAAAVFGLLALRAGRRRRPTT